MTNAWFRAVVILLLGSSFACSTPAPVASEPRTDRLAVLEHRFNHPDSDSDKIRVAIELIRSGVADPAYREFIHDEAEKALASEEEAAAEWNRQHGFSQRQTHERPPVAQTVSYAGPRNAITSKSAYAAVPYGVAVPVPAVREPDPTNLLPIVAVSMTATTGDPAARDQLRRALCGSNGLLAAEGALGLARMKERDAIPEIIDAARRFKQPLAFARALIYYNDAKANAEARVLLNNPALYKEMQQTASDRAYDPYHRK
jgi:hypothetical protein